MKNQFISRLPAFIFLFSFLLTILFHVDFVQAADGGENTPINIEADKMLSHQKENAIIFIGNVKAVQGEIVLYADKMTVYHEQDGQKTDRQESGSGKFKKIFATGNVKLTKEDWVATGNQVEFFTEEKKVLLTGDAKVWQGNNIITGESVLLDLKENTTVIEPGKKSGERVKAFFYPN